MVLTEPSTDVRPCAAATVLTTMSHRSRHTIAKETEMRSTRTALLIIGCVLMIPGLILLLVGAALGFGYAFGRGTDGYFDATLDRLATPTAAITTDDITFAADPGSPDWVLDALDADIRLRATSSDVQREIFIGIGPQAEVDEYLDDVSHDVVIDLTDDLDPVYASEVGSANVTLPTEQDFWAASAVGLGDQEITWEATTGEWSAVLMNADGSAGVIADVNVGTKAEFLVPLAVGLLIAGFVVTAAAVAIIIAGTRPSSNEPVRDTANVDSKATESSLAEKASPVRLTATLDPELSRWRWLIKWLLAIPHFIVLAFLWMGFVVATFVAAVSILVTRTYPKGIFEFNVGVLRWSWRVSHYATTGGLGTDRYPPFSLRAQPGDAASLDVRYPHEVSRGLVLVKWLLALPHLLIVSLLAGSSVRWLAFEGDRVSFDATGGGGILGLLSFIAGLVLLFRGRYPQALFDLILGFNRWIYRTVAYVALMTDEYPPFRLDQGGTETQPGSPPTAPPSGEPHLDLRAAPELVDEHRQ